MFGKRAVLAALVIAVSLEGCSSRPRQFAPRLAAAPTAEQKAAFDQDFRACSDMLIAGKLDRSGKLASAGAGAAVGAATVAGGAAAASSAGLYTGMAVLGAALIAAPVLALGGAWGMARAKRGKKEKVIKEAMTGCLAERGHQVTGWDKTGRKMQVDPLGKKSARRLRRRAEAFVQRGRQGR